jgi:protein-S-isoprenylcysteine O-methyltransferase Ste14
MLTEQEEKFLSYWEYNRKRKKKLFWRLAAGLPLGVFIAAAIFINYFSTWYTRAVMEINLRSSGVLVVLIGLIGIVIFVVVFSARHRWEMNEQRYQELMNKKNRV